jgi:GMP synthase (glutamine-hydrolysing)
VILILQHEPREGPGRIGEALVGPTRTIRLCDGAPLPSSLDGIDGILSLGGEANTHEPATWPERDLLKQAHDAHIPIVGVCLGSQLLACATGGAVGPMPPEDAESGWYPVHRTQPDPLFDGLPDPMMQFHAHRYQVTHLPPGGTVLMSSTRCPVQAFRVGPRSVGIQFHPEWYEDLLRTFTPDVVSHYAEYDRLGAMIAQRLGTHLSR